MEKSPYSTKAGKVIIVGSILLLVLAIYIGINKDKLSGSHLYGSTYIDTTCWNKNDQLHYILKETRLELKQCNFLTQELADSIKALRALYGTWMLKYEEELKSLGYYDDNKDSDTFKQFDNQKEKYDKYNINQCAGKNHYQPVNISSNIHSSNQVDLKGIYKMYRKWPQAIPKYPQTAVDFENPITSFKIPSYNSGTRHRITISNIGQSTNIIWRNDGLRFSNNQ